MITLKEACLIWFEDNNDSWKPITSRYIRVNFEEYVFPALGDFLMHEIKAKQIVAMIKNTERTAPTVAKRILGRLSTIFDIAIINEHCEHNPARPVRVALKKHTGGSFSFLDEEKLAGFYKRIDKKNTRGSAVERAFWAIQYTALRRSEAVLGRKEEVNFNLGIWTIPAARMKKNKDHIVPITTQLRKILNDCFTDNETPWLFPSPHKKGKYHINTWMPLFLIRQAGYETEMTIHGARKVFSTIAHESGLWSIDAIELQLSHSVAGVRGVYNKAQLITERTRLVQWFADKIDGMRYD